MSKPTVEKKLSNKQYAIAILQVAKLTYRAAPFAIVVKIIGSIITAVLPIATTYFAAQTTTALAAAYAGDHTAGGRATLFVIITASLGVLMAAWNSFDRYAQDLMRYKIEAAMSDRLYEHFLSLDFWRYDDKSTADLYEQAGDFSMFFPYVFDRLASIVTQFITMLAGLIALMFVSWWLGFIAILCILPGVYVQFKLSRAQIKHNKSQLDTRRTKNMVEWELSRPKHTAELRLYGLARHLLDLRQTLRDKDERTRIEFENTFILKQLLADMLETAAEVTALLWTVSQIIGRMQPIGQFIYVQQIVSRALSGAEGFVSVINGLDKDLANLFGYQTFMQLPERNGSQSVVLDTSPNKIELLDISFRYPQSKAMILSTLSMTIEKGQHIAIVGENGAGKSTLVKIITGLYEPTTGGIYVDGFNMRDIRIGSWHQYLSVLQQDHLEYDFATAKDNIRFGNISKLFDDTVFNKAIDNAEARTFLEKLPKGADSYIYNWMEHEDGTQGADLSGGQRQRLALARGFYRDSPIVILDEPTSAIDALAESHIFKRLFSDRDKTIITISHRLTTIEKADIIYMLKNGRIVEQGTHDSLISRKGEYFKMFESQLRGHEK